MRRASGVLQAASPAHLSGTLTKAASDWPGMTGKADSLFGFRATQLSLVSSRQICCMMRRLPPLRMTKGSMTRKTLQASSSCRCVRVLVVTPVPQTLLHCVVLVEHLALCCVACRDSHDSVPNCGVCTAGSSTAHPGLQPQQVLRFPPCFSF